MHNLFSLSARRALACGIAWLAMLAVLSVTATAQTPGGTQIQNRASASYSDGNGNNYSTASNTVTVTVSNVSGISITPDAGTRLSVVAGQFTIFNFRITNTGNFADQVRFLANGASVSVTGPGTIVAAVIDLDSSGNVTPGDIDINTNAADVLSSSIAQNGFIDVAVRVQVNANAASGDSLRVQLGDASTGSPTFDNQPANNSANEVRTVSTAGVNGVREGRGDLTALVENDAQLLLSLTAPAGPLPLGSDIAYTWQLQNPGAREAQAVTLANAPAGANRGVFIIAPVPFNTVLKAGQTFPAGTLYTTSPLSTDPLQAVWTTTPPANLAQVTRVAFNVGNAAASYVLAQGATSPNIPMLVTVTTNNASTIIYEIGDAFALNSIGTVITDQSGDLTRNAGDGNANFNEGAANGNIDGNGVQQQTTLQAAGSVFLGPNGAPDATGPTNRNDDYTNHSVINGIANVAPGGVTTAGDTVVFTNTLQNTGNANDIYQLTVPNLPSGFTVRVSIDNGASYTTVQPGNGTISLPVPFGETRQVLVQVIAPSGLAVLNSYDTVLRATSTNTPSVFNETINRLYTGFVRLEKAASVTNNTGIGGATDAVSGADIEFVITYTNVSMSGGSPGNVQLNASNLRITEDGNAAPNNWGATTTQVVGSASDTRGGAITGDTADSTSLIDVIPTLGANQSGVFRFKRRIR